MLSMFKGGLTTTRHDLVEVILPIILEHLICLVYNDVAHTAKSESLGAINHVCQTTRSPDQDVATLAELLFLGAHRATTINHAGPKHGPIAELPGFVEDLNRQLPRRQHDDDERLSAEHDVSRRVIGRGVRAVSREFLGLSHQLVQDRNEISASLARA